MVAGRLGLSEQLAMLEAEHGVQFFTPDPTMKPKPRKTAKPKVIK